MFRWQVNLAFCGFPSWVIDPRPHWPAHPSDGFSVFRPRAASHSQHIKPPNLSLFPSILSVPPVLFPTPPFPTFPHPSNEHLSLALSLHPNRRCNAACCDSSRSPFLTIARPQRIAHPRRAPSLALVVTHSPFLSRCTPNPLGISASRFPIPPVSRSRRRP